MDRAWIYLIVAGILEIAWAIGVKYTEGFTRIGPSIFTVLAIAASMYCLSLAAQVIPLGTAYGVWVGIGAAGAAIFGIMIGGEPASLARLGFIALLIVSLVGLKMTS